MKVLLLDQKLIIKYLDSRKQRTDDRRYKYVFLLNFNLSVIRRLLFAIFKNMAKEISLEAQIREEKNGKMEKVGEAGFIPANIYGPGVDNQNIRIKELDFIKVFKDAGESSLINLIVDKKDPIKVVVKDTQKNPVKDNFTHIDFYQVDMSKKITAEISLKFIGEARAVKELGGILVKSIDSVEAKCLPGDLVDNIEVSLESLDDYHKHIRIGDIKLPQGIELTADASETVATVVEPVKEEEIKEVEEVEGEEGEESAEEGKEGEPSSAKASEGKEEEGEKDKPAKAKEEKK